MNIAKYIDHTLLKPDALKKDVKRICEEAIKYEFASVCVNQYHTNYVKELLSDSKVKVCTVVGFPLGAVDTGIKAFETAKAVKDGADEIDMVINIGALKDRDYDYVLNDIKEVVKAANNNVVKVIIETGLLSDDEKIKACELAVKAGAHFVKTSTGFSKGGATVDDIILMRKTVGEGIGVKASGGIRDYETAIAVIKAGANRIGASSSIAIVENKIKNNDGDY